MSGFTPFIKHKTKEKETYLCNFRQVGESCTLSGRNNKRVFCGQNTVGQQTFVKWGKFVQF